MKKTIIYIGICAVFVILAAIFLIWFLSGDKIEPGIIGPEKTRTRPGAETAQSVVQEITEWYEAVGTVVSKNQARIEPLVAGQITEVRVQAGDIVEKGDLLVRVDDQQLRSRISQARQQVQASVNRRDEAMQAVNSARAAFQRAQSAYNRIKSFHEAQAASQQELEEAQSAYLQAEAALQRARDGVSAAESGVSLAREMLREAEIARSYADIKAPENGSILKRLVDPGDMAAPGKPLLIMRADGGMQLEASVREGLMSNIRPNDVLKVRLSSLGRTVEAVIDEIIPSIDPLTRTFLVKAGLPESEDVYPGMYGKLLIPYRKVPVILVPQKAVRRVGQLELVNVKTKDGWHRRCVKTGKIHGDRVEILSGLEGQETVLIQEPGENDR
jgi:RND family efflux transporter MFP subunit